MSKASNHVICMRFIRATDVHSAGKRDDVAKIRSVGHDLYAIRMRNVDEERVVEKEMIVDREGVREWYVRTLKLVDADYVPFEQYQFDFPMMPSVLIHHRELHHHMPALIYALDFHLENWPQRYTVQQQPTHLYFDDDDA